MAPLPGWMRRALYATGMMNVLAAGAFLPPAAPVRAVMGFPATDEPLYTSIVALMVATFGGGHLWAAATGRAERLFIGVAALGKIGFFALISAFWAAGAVSGRAAASAAADLAFGVAFVAWLLEPRAAAT
jgi:hypothetical protein